jgi:hypothetical protein
MSSVISEAHLRRIVREFLLAEGKEMLFSAPGHTCAHCGGKVDDSGECEKCGVSVQEYIAQGLSNMGKVDRVTERAGKGGFPKTQASAKKMVAKLARDPGPTWGDVTQYAQSWGAENPDAYAATLLRIAGGKPGKRKRGG